MYLKFVFWGTFQGARVQLMELCEVSASFLMVHVALATYFMQSLQFMLLFIHRRCSYSFNSFEQLRPVTDFAEKSGPRPGPALSVERWPGQARPFPKFSAVGLARPFEDQFSPKKMLIDNIFAEIFHCTLI